MTRAVAPPYQLQSLRRPGGGVGCAHRHARRQNGVGGWLHSGETPVAITSAGASAVCAVDLPRAEYYVPLPCPPPIRTPRFFTLFRSSRNPIMIARRDRDLSVCPLPAASRFLLFLPFPLASCACMCSLWRLFSLDGASARRYAGQTIVKNRIKIHSTLNRTGTKRICRHSGALSPPPPATRRNWARRRGSTVVCAPRDRPHSISRPAPAPRKGRKRRGEKKRFFFYIILFLGQREKRQKGTRVAPSAVPCQRAVMGAASNCGIMTLRQAKLYLR